MRKYKTLILLFCVSMLTACTIQSQSKKDIYPKVFVKITDESGAVIPFAFIEEQYLYNDGTKDPIVKSRAEGDGTYTYGVSIEERDLSDPYFSIEMWIHAEGYEPARQIFQVRQQETVINFKLTRKSK